MHIKIASSCVRGIAHKALDMPCQDYVASMQEGQRAVIALADGAGSRMFSQIGAQIATQTVCKICMEAFDSLFEMQEEVLAHYLSEKIQNELHNGTYSLSELSCTLLFYAMDKDRFISGHIGDGMIFRIRNTEADILSYPENGAEANQTYFITEEDACKHLRLQKGPVEARTTVLLCSDGSMASLYGMQKKEPASAVAKFAEWLNQEDEHSVSMALYNNMEQFFTENSKDDLSIIMLQQDIEEQ